MGAWPACSGHTALHDRATDASAGAGGTGGSYLSTGGMTSQEGSGGMADAAVVINDAVAGAESPCDLSALWGLLWIRFNDQPTLVMTSCQAADSVVIDVGGIKGQIVFDADGRIVDDTNYRAGTGGPDKDDWLTQVSGYRWPCMAGSTLAYVCSMYGD